jgi:hypothetical protein
MHIKQLGESSPQKQKYADDWTGEAHASTLEQADSPSMSPIHTHTFASSVQVRYVRPRVGARRGMARGLDSGSWEFWREPMHAGSLPYARPKGEAYRRCWVVLLSLFSSLVVQYFIRTWLRSLRVLWRVKLHDPPLPGSSKNPVNTGMPFRNIHSQHQILRVQTREKVAFSRRRKHRARYAPPHTESSWASLPLPDCLARLVCCLSPSLTLFPRVAAYPLPLTRTVL